MPIEFSTWMSRMANTIPDNSIVERYAGEDLTALQKRMLMADLVVPCQRSASAVADWLSIFAIDLDLDQDQRSYYMKRGLGGLLGTEQYTLYIDCKKDRETVLWLEGVKTLIKTGSLK